MEIIIKISALSTQYFLWDQLSSICSYLSAWISTISSLISMIVIVYSYYKWSDIQRQKGIEVYAILNESCNNILQVLSMRDLFEYDGYFPDRIPTESIDKEKPWRSQYRPYRLIFNELQTIKKQTKNYLIINDELISLSFKKIETAIKSILSLLAAKNNTDQKEIIKNYPPLEENALLLKQEVEKISEYIVAKIKA